ncbi:hypothetical protein [Microbacterium deminutum]
MSTRDAASDPTGYDAGFLAVPVFGCPPARRRRLAAPTACA